MPNLVDLRLGLPLAASVAAIAPPTLAQDDLLPTRSEIRSLMVESSVVGLDLRLDGSALATLPNLRSLVAFAGAGEPSSPPAASNDADLAKKLSNPVADLISVPFQFNYDEGFGPKDAGRLTLNIQPVVPIELNTEWNLIIRTIVPVIYQGSTADGIDSAFGLGDTIQSFFLSPSETLGGWIIGAGPVALWPTGTSPEIRSESLGFGPTVVALRQQEGWTYGVLANHIWSVHTSDGRPDVNSTFLQPFLTYTFPSATTLGINSESSYDWESDQWTVPINLFVSQMVRLGSQPLQFTLGGRYYPESPSGGPEWGLRFVVTLLFPT